jgi:elongation factor Ts
MKISIDLIRELREKTNAGISDCRQALEETNGDLEKAREQLKKKGLIIAAKKASRETKEGVIASYIHSGSKIGVIVEINCETDFVARNDIFKNFVKDIMLQIASANPLYLNKESVPPEVLEKEKQMYKEQVAGKPENVAVKIIEGKLNKWYSEVCLLEQPFIKEPDKTTIKDLLTAKIAELGENMGIRRFTRYHLGE